MPAFYPANTQPGMPNYIGKTPVEQLGVSELIDWLYVSIELSNGLDPEFTTTAQIRRLCCQLDTELRKRGEF